MKVTRILQLVIPTLNELTTCTGVSNVTYNPTRDDVENPWYIRFVAGGRQEITFTEEIGDNYFKENITRLLTVLDMCAKLLDDEGFTLRYKWTDEEREVSINCNVKGVFDKVPGEIEYGRVYEADPKSRLGAFQQQLKRYAGVEVGFFAQGPNIVRMKNDGEEV